VPCCRCAAPLPYYAIYIERVGGALNICGLLRNLLRNTCAAEVLPTRVYCQHDAGLGDSVSVLINAIREELALLAGERVE